MRPRTTTTTAALLATAFLVLGALLGLASTAQAHSTGGAHTAATAPKTVNIMIKDYAFSPAEVTVNPGDTVIWTNMDTAKHDSKSLSGPATFGGPLMGQGETYTWVATASGAYSYYCSVHPDMKAKLTVAPAVAAPAATTPAPAKAPATRAPVAGATKAPARAAAAPTARTSSAAPAAPAAAGGSGSSTGTVAQQRAAAAAEAAAAPVTQAITPVSEPEDTLDPTLLVIALAAGATVFALLALGPRAPRMVKVVVPPTSADQSTT